MNRHQQALEKRAPNPTPAAGPKTGRAGPSAGTAAVTELKRRILRTVAVTIDRPVWEGSTLADVMRCVAVEVYLPSLGVMMRDAKRS